MNTDILAFPGPGDLPEGTRLLGELRCNLPHGDIGDQAIREALDHPIWPDGKARTVSDIVQAGESVCIVVSDYTRETAADRVLPILIERLVDAGCRPENVTLLIACGIHRPPTAGEIAGIVGPHVSADIRRRTVAHDPDNARELRHVGTTRRGHPVYVHRLAAESDHVILTGAAAYHYHAGFGGGRKSLVPGVASRETIAFNHSLTLDPDIDCIHPSAAPGILDGNPVAEEMLESARLCKPDMIVNTVIGPGGQLVAVVAGELDAAHRQACRAVENMCRVDLEEQAHVVIASASGAPNWIQSHKGLFNAHRAITPDGSIVLLAPCPEGVGNDAFRKWVRVADTGALFAALRLSPEILGQTALSTRTRGRQAILVTDLPRRDTDEMGMRQAGGMQAAIDMAVREQRERGHNNPRILLMPEARYTVPFEISDLS